jgi:phenylacetate-CoA ligase
MYTRFCSGAAFPVHEWLKGHSSVAMRRELERTQWLSRGELERLQFGRLKEFLTRAARNVPYYRDLFARCGFDPSGLSSADDLGAVPFLTKPLIRENTDRLKSDRAGPLTRFSTGGSTGEPLLFHMGRMRISHDVAAKWRATRWWGVDIGDPEIVLWGSPIELGAQDRIRLLRDRILRTRLLPAFEMSETRMEEYLQSIRRFRPRMLFGYASALARLASFARVRGIPMDDLGARVAFTTGETLYPDQRNIIQEVFGAPVANGYGARDAGFIAHECPSGSLHISSEHVLVEIVAEDGVRVPNGTMGEVVVTHLGTGDFPFVRYRTGDFAVLGERGCACGRGLGVLETVYGRSTDFIRTATGGVMHALALIYEVREQPGVRTFKFVQAEDYSIELQLVAGPDFEPGDERAMLARLRRRLGEDTPIRIARVDHMAPEKSGKHRYVVSRANTTGEGSPRRSTDERAVPVSTR